MSDITTDLSYLSYLLPCGAKHRPVTLIWGEQHSFTWGGCLELSPVQAELAPHGMGG